jgi:hypothetical protein
MKPGFTEVELLDAIPATTRTNQNAKRRPDDSKAD